MNILLEPGVMRLNVNKKYDPQKKCVITFIIVWLFSSITKCIKQWWDRIVFDWDESFWYEYI